MSLLERVPDRPRFFPFPLLNSALSAATGPFARFPALVLPLLIALLSASLVAQSPTITSLSQSSGAVGAPITITGTNFGGTQGTSTVTFNGSSAAVGNWNSTTITVSVPTGATNGNVVVHVGGLDSNGIPFTVIGPVSYLYDDLGRLAAVIDGYGNAAIYTYDAVGNILSINQVSPTQVSIIQFTPARGPVGTAVTISGTGFSTTASQNSVSFNGTAATVSSATSTILQVTVPSGATSGTISVVSPAGSATSAGAFTVTADNGAPTITSFSPQNALTGATINIVGTNFDPVLSNDKLRVNVSAAVASSITSTTNMTGVVPSATASGHISVITSAGKGVSSQDLYIPFGTHAVSDIGFTGRIASGNTQPVTLAANKIGMLLFDSVAGQHFSIQMSGSTFATCTLYIIGPDNATVRSSNCTSITTNVDAILPKTGTHTIGIDPGASTGSINITLSADAVGTIAIDGPAVTATTTAVAQDARLTFSATGGQRIVVYATSVTNPSATLNLQKPDGTIQAYMYIGNSPAGQTFFLDTQGLAATGSYKLWVQHSGTYVGSETLRIASVPADFTSPITVPATGQTGPAVRVPASGNLAVGQNATITFSGTSGQILSFNVLSPTIGTAFNSCTLRIYNPSNSQIVVGNCGTGASNYIDAVSLTATGTYSIVIDPQATATGSVSLSINNDSDVTGTITIDGSAVTSTTTVAGQDVRLTFSATAGQRIVVYATSVTNPSANIYLVKPDGTNQTSFAINNLGGQTFFLDTQTLATTGSYQLWVKHVTTNVGSETLRIASVPADFTSTITVPAAGQTGPAVRVPTSGNLAAGQNATLTFSGTTGQKLSFNVLSPTIGTTSGSCLVRIYDPSNNQITFGYCGPGSSNYIDTVALTANGTYSIAVDPQGAATGSVSLSINNASDVTGTIAIDGSAVTSTTTAAGQDARLTFSATAGQRVVVFATSVTNPSANVYLVKPDGTNQTSFAINNIGGQTFFLDTQTLATTGSYTLWVKHITTNVGSETLRIASVPADLSGSVSIGGSAFAVTTVAGQNANITFSNPQSQTVTVHWTSGTYPSTPGCSLRVTGPSPSQTQVGFANCNTATGSVSLGTQPSGTYNILVDPQQQSTGGLSLTVTSP
jgi:YD repeat-containing protein